MAAQFQRARLTAFAAALATCVKCADRPESRMRSDFGKSSPASTEVIVVGAVEKPSGN